MEECSDGWTICGGLFVHQGHSLIQSCGSSLSDATLRAIPHQLIDLGHSLRRAGFSISHINRALECEGRQLGLSINWTYQDVYNKFSETPHEKILDTSNFLHYLRTRYEDKNLYFDLTTDCEGCLNKIFWVLEDGLANWSENIENNVLLYDTSHGTNRYDLKIGVFSTVDKNGRTVIISCSLLCNEVIESFEWIFGQFTQAFYVPAKVIFTDGDPAMANAIRSIFPDTVHLLCTYHISKNIFSHIKPLFSGRIDDSKWRWNKFIKNWWTICKK